MLGAILGDIIGSAYEFNNTKDYDFPMFISGTDFTDDSILTVAVADWLMSDSSYSEDKLVETLVRYGREFPHPTGGYGGGFSSWLFFPGQLRSYGDDNVIEDRQPYGSWGNGSAMRVSAVGWYFDSLEETERVAGISAGVTHNHPEGIMGAQATAAAIYMARNGASKEEIKDYVSQTYAYNLDRSWEELHQTYTWDSSCQGTVPEAIICFLESHDFEDAIRKAVSIGGDSDTLACITGGIAEAYYRIIPDFMLEQFEKRLPSSLLEVYNRFRSFVLVKGPMNQYPANG